MPHNCSVEARQCNSASFDLHQQDGGDTVSTAVPTSPLHIEMLPAKANIPDSRTSSREGEPCGRPRVQDSEGLLRLDAKPRGVQSDLGMHLSVLCRE